MSSKKRQKDVKPMEEWGAKEWEAAYNVLNSKYLKLRELMRRAIQTLSVAI